MRVSVAESSGTRGIMTALFVHCAACSRCMCRKVSAVTSQDAGNGPTGAEGFNIIQHSFLRSPAHSLTSSQSAPSWPKIYTQRRQANW